MVQRFHYDVERLSEEGVAGWRRPEELNLRRPESNQASGTAIRIRSDLYPSGIGNGFFAPQLAAIHDILAETNGVVRWGGHDGAIDESLFYIVDEPGSRRLAPNFHALVAQRSLLISYKSLFGVDVQLE